MKRIFIMLLIACSAITTINAQQRVKKQTQTTPIHVKTLFNDIIMTWGNPSDEVFSINSLQRERLVGAW